MAEADHIDCRTTISDYYPPAFFVWWVAVEEDCRSWTDSDYWFQDSTSHLVYQPDSGANRASLSVAVIATNFDDSIGASVRHSAWLCQQCRVNQKGTSLGTEDQPASQTIHKWLSTDYSPPYMILFDRDCSSSYVWRSSVIFTHAALLHALSDLFFLVAP